jgi:hypothetical protein
MDASRRHTPAIAEVRFTKYVDSIVPSRGFWQPGLKVICQLLGERPDPTVSRDVPLELETGKRGHNLAESCCRHADLEIIVVAGSVSGEQLQRPSGRDVPWGVDVRKPLSDFTGRP